MIEMCKAVMTGFSNYIYQNHLLVLAIGAAILLLFFREKKGCERIAVLGLVMSILLWIPVSGLILMKLQTSLYSYESLWSSLVPVPALIALGAVTVMQKQEKDSKQYAVSAVVVLLLIFLLGNMGNISIVQAEEQKDSSEIGQIMVAVQMEQYNNRGDYGADKLWAPSEVITELRERSGEITLLYGRDLWETKVAAYAYDSYDADIISLFDLMESLSETDIYEGIEDPEAKENAMNERGLTEGRIMALAKMSGSGLWIMPRSAERRINYALHTLETEYNYRVDVVTTVENYIIYRIEEY